MEKHSLDYWPCRVSHSNDLDFSHTGASERSPIPTEKMFVIAEAIQGGFVFSRLRFH